MTLATSAQDVQVDAQSYLKDLQKLVSNLEDDLRVRSQELPDVHQRLTREYNQARSNERTLATFESWRDDYLTQVAVAWVLSGVFLRYLEDNQLIDEVWLAGEGERLTRAHDRHQLYFQRNPKDTDRQYLQEAFRTAARLPGCRELFGEERNPLWLLGPSGDAAKELLAFWQAIDPATGHLLRTFGDPESGKTASTRFLGDLYQDLSESARKRYALLQTPDFVEEFILDQTLDPAIETFGLEEVRMLDPTCGSGHFLLGGFSRLLKRWRERAPAVNDRELVQRALNGIYGVDVNPFAVAIARFRLLLAALTACRVRRLKDAPDFKVHVAIGDSLLHGRCYDGQLQTFLSVDQDWIPDAFSKGDFQDATEILAKHYHVVVGNPPYIVDPDVQRKSRVRRLYRTASSHLFISFTERFFDLCVRNGSNGAGWVGLIIAHAFTRKPFGKKLVTFLSEVDVECIVDTSTIRIPGHGTPTIILFARNRLPVGDKARLVTSSAAIPEEPEVVHQTWQEIVEVVAGRRSSTSDVNVTAVEREILSRHPWILVAGPPADILDIVAHTAKNSVSDYVDSIGFASFPGTDPAFLLPMDALRRRGLCPGLCREIVVGENVRDWCIQNTQSCIFPYSNDMNLIALPDAPLLRHLWPYRTRLAALRKGSEWWSWIRLTRKYFEPGRRLTFPLGGATHNHFVIPPNDVVFKSTAPVVKLRQEVAPQEHIVLQAILNSSLGCFLLKNTCGHNRERELTTMGRAAALTFPGMIIGNFPARRSSACGSQP